MEIFEQIVGVIDDFMWGWPMIILLLGTHIFMTIRTGVIQRKLPKAIKLSVTKDPESSGDVSQFQALTTALASTIGTGNIIGVGTAIALGGYGAVFWCWITGVLGIATKYAESFIGVKYRVKTKDGSMVGGAMYALERGLNMKWLGIIFAVLAALAAFGIGNGVQINAISSVLTDTFDADKALNINLFGLTLPVIPLVCGLAAALLTGIVLFGGVKSISRVCEKLVPLMAILYVGGCIYILCYNWQYIGQAVQAILSEAFSLKSVAGGFMGTALMMGCRYGIARGLFSNESGMGSAPIVAAAAKTRNPVRQALVSSTGTFWDTVVVCLMTGLVIVSSCIANPAIDTVQIDGASLTNAAFAQIPYVGPVIIVVGIVTFAYSTILGWSYYAERCIVYLFGLKALPIYRVVWIVVLAIAPLLAVNVVWNIADILNACMALPNIFAVWMLSGDMRKDTKYYLDHIDEYDKTPIPMAEK